MSTSDVDQLTPAGLLESPKAAPDSVGASQGVDRIPSGLPDPATLARMAAEFFSELPTGGNHPERELPGDFPASPASISSFPGSAPAFRPEVPLPSDLHFPSAPASAGGATLSPATAPFQATPPAIPGALGSAMSSDEATPPAFSFLQDVRPIFSDTHTTPTYPPARPIVEFMPDEAPLSGFPATLDDDALRNGIALAQPPSPTMPSTFSFVDSSAVPSFSFLEEARPLFSYPPTIPGPVPAFPGSAPALPESDLLSSAPGSVARSRQASGVEPPEYGSGSSLGFFDGLRPIFSADPVSRVEPSEIDPDVPRDLNLSSHPFDAQALKRDFPILRERVNGRQLVWLDNAATTQKPQSVIDRLKYFYEHENSNVHRAAHELAARATDAYESAREKVRRFLNASSTREIIFVRGATEGINLVAQSWGRRNIQKDDEIVITWLEHHANIVPWQMLCAEKGAKLRVAPVDDSGQIRLDEYEKLLGPKTRLVALPQVSNALGTVTPAREMIEAAHRHGARVLLDGAQSVSHMRVDVQSLDCDFFVFSGHKVFAPTGIGVVYGKADVLEHMPPWQGGGNMIQDVTFEKTTYHPPPQRFEAGTGNIADAVGLGAAIDYLDRVGMANISRHEHALLVYGTQALKRIPGLHIVGMAKEKAGVLSFVMDGFRNEEIGDYLNRNGIAVRSGHHCAQPILRRFGLESTVRASLALYNTFEDIDALATALLNLRLGHTSIS